MEVMLNLIYDWNGVCFLYIFVIENDSLNVVNMLFGNFLIG